MQQANCVKVRCVILLGITLLVFAACKNKETGYQASEPVAANEQHPGKALMETYCYACHDPMTSMEERIAPPMIAVKNHYINETTSKEAFMADFTSWMTAPSQDKSKMPGAIQKFGVMPFTPYPEDIIQKIGEYLYDYEIEVPEDFKQHQGNGMQKRMRKGMGQQEPKKSYQKRGMEIALSTKGVLGKNLIGTVQKKGVNAALEFCNVQAYPLTDSMASVHSAKIKRVSDRFRNPLNKANVYETSLIAAYQEKLNKMEAYEATIDSSGATVQFYFPIVTNDLCLKCHGNPQSNIEPGVLTTIQTLYPDDRATGYDVNQVRGLWSIQMKKE